MLKNPLKLYSRYRSWARRYSGNSMLLNACIGLVGVVVVLGLKLLGDHVLHAVLPWLIIALGFIAALDSLGAALERRSKLEGLIRFCLVLILFGGPGIWLLCIW